MNTELEGVLERLRAGLEDLLGKLDLDLDGTLDLERDLDRDDVGVLERDRVGVRELEGRRVRVELADGHRKGPVFPGPTKRVQDPVIGPETVPALH
jgi:hypothetical protein